MHVEALRTVSVIFTNSYKKGGLSFSQWYPLNLFLSNKKKFLFFFVFFPTIAFLVSIT